MAQWGDMRDYGVDLTKVIRSLDIDSGVQTSAPDVDASLVVSHTARMTQQPKPEPIHRTSRIIRKPALAERIGVHHMTIWRWCKSGTFPKPVRLGANSIGWYEHEIEEWLNNRSRER
jgi:prophage regulatory protein